jgi:hypothetical protein
MRNHGPSALLLAVALVSGAAAAAGDDGAFRITPLNDPAS